MKTQTEVRAAFWNAQDEDYRRRYWHPTMRQNSYPCDVRMAWCDFVEMLSRDGQISEKLAQRVTL